MRYEGSCRASHTIRTHSARRWYKWWNIHDDCDGQLGQTQRITESVGFQMTYWYAFLLGLVGATVTNVALTVLFNQMGWF